MLGLHTCTTILSHTISQPRNNSKTKRTREKHLNGLSPHNSDWFLRLSEISQCTSTPRHIPYVSKDGICTLKQGYASKGNHRLGTTRTQAAPFTLPTTPGCSFKLDQTTTINLSCTPSLETLQVCPVHSGKSKLAQSTLLSVHSSLDSSKRHLAGSLGPTTSERLAHV